VSLAAVPLAILFMAMTAIVFCGLGVAIGSVLQDMQGFQLIMNFLVLPIFVLSGALFPLANLPRALAIVTSVDPLSYGVDGIRGALAGLSHFGPAADVAVLTAVALLFLALGGHLFSKIQI
jgi:ABC-2 type transport system permease protein